MERYHHWSYSIDFGKTMNAFPAGSIVHGFFIHKTKKGKLIMTKKRKLFTGMAIFMLLMMTFAVTVFAGGEAEAPKPQMYATFLGFSTSPL